MKQYRTFLLQQHGVPENRVPFYESWVTQAYDYLKRDLGQELTPEEMQSFLAYISKIWGARHVDQAREALNLYLALKQKNSRKVRRNHHKELTWKKALDEFIRVLRSKNRSTSTEKNYVSWVKSFRQFVQDKAPLVLTDEDSDGFLQYLADERKVSLSTQNQAFNALLFFFRHVLRKEITHRQNLPGKEKKRALPIVLTRDEVSRIFDHMTGTPLLMAQLIYGSGLQLRECVTLRVSDIDYERNMVRVRVGEDKKERNTLLPQRLKDSLREQRDNVRRLAEKDRRDNVEGTFQHSDETGTTEPEWNRQWLFPSASVTADPQSGIAKRNHIHPNTLQKQVTRAASLAGIAKPVSVQTLRHTFATHLLEMGYDIRTVQELLGHSSVQTTMIYTQVMGKTRRHVTSPLDSEIPPS